MMCPWKMKKPVLPRPVNGPVYDGWTLEKWMLKVCEETGEAVTACKRLNRKVSSGVFEPVEGRSKYKWYENTVPMIHKEYDDLCMELTDVITAATSMLEYLGCDLEERQMFQKKINGSNAVRDGGRRFREE